MRSSHATGTDRTGTALVNIALAAGVLFTAVAEYHLARALGSGQFVAALLPAAIDVYVIAAVRRGRAGDIAGALAIMGSAQVAAHLLEAQLIIATVPLIVGVSLLVPLVIWRVHALQAPPRPDSVAEPVVASAAVPDTGPAALPRVVLVPYLVPAAAKRGSKVGGKARGTNEGRGAAGSQERVSPENLATARRLLADNPSLNGVELGQLLGTSDGYGRRVRRAALARP
ncbi:hypothetical protein [Streptomyces indicus]|uniref:DUF2637 domain-containing protein n=1 Tax=Streptomyces indicus TaxID=417292 RepID=A0A1G8W8T1_9ACTN|nr:hypothetical protein [Streptomyces indicus]SDJ74701.1 hypothetical protein SAMN05421806_102310 [Streptomyces indicus]